MQKTILSVLMRLYDLLKWKLRRKWKVDYRYDINRPRLT